MKIKITKSCKFSFRPCEPIAHFKLGGIHDLSDSQAKRLIACGYAILAGSEQKMDKAEKEDKMFNVKHKEDKTKDAEIKVKHEFNPKKNKKKR